ncbi:homoprotocatechuate degradation operon regulator HpaR [Rhizorhabdus wittichii]|jgi:homoprotocatechuate degradation regulator HpaR|uniref:homoprotocatechuate degradation operon regulator HpaR n=1 Tax=Rhizorhabdus wittichii TaxID=160791 RepID=UPI0003110C53|nr:homoprotocatechuate degradation operon regulator HpaR [Rhizorhabdus wittichii]
MQEPRRKLQPYRQSLAGTLLAAREAVMAPLRPMLRDAGVTEQQWRVLRVIRDSQPIDATALADAALLFGPSVTRILKELLDRRLIVRETDPRDRRRSIVTLTPAGRALIEHTASQTVQVLDRYAERFGPERLDALKNELRALIDAIGPLGED